MHILPTQSSLPVSTSSDNEKADCVSFVKIAVFAISMFLLLAGIVILSGAFGNLGDEIGWTIAALGLVGLAISCVRCSKNDHLSNTNGHQSDPFMSSTYHTTQNDFAWSTPQENNLFQGFSSNHFSTSSIGHSQEPFSQKNTRSDNPHLKQAETYFVQGDLAAALKEIKKILGDDEIKEPFIARVAKAHLQNGDKVQAFKTIKEIYHNSEIKETFLAELAQAYRTEGNKEQAFKTIKEIYHNSEIKETFLAELAQAYRTEGNKEQAFKTIKEIIHNSEIKETFLAELAQAYRTEGNKEQAFKTIKEIYHNSEIKETCLAQLAQAYLAEGNKEQAFKTIKEIIHNSEIKEAFLAQLAQVYFAEGNKEQAFKTIKEIIHNLKIKEAFLAKLAQAYFNDANESGVLQILVEVIRISLTHKLIEGYCDKLFEITKRNSRNTKIRDFFAQRAQECYNEVKVHFEQDKSEIAITLTKDKAISSKYLQEFLKL
jgi:predicted Zn-dependent protease